ncbi:hypothetical protein M2103_001668 [Ereboglobus sp. PH5-5]|uniref:hypothetical protein n=1 Tax=unclassified Ereboglobus TaxID=2626932 RepID=UPI0024069FFA|nr:MULTISPECIES: hypothetical protein [unclassified Ereboglobus]MDF9826668.1 hypothetical protein [Ereboglobus sp. PH5-10]MDF9833444.1 hypothetical protein [Ereboglobus sp. PH5-5]
MKTLKWFATLTMAALLSSGALNARDVSDYLKELEKSPAPEPGKEYYLRYCIWHENDAHNTTNYTRGDLVPANTKVTLLELSGRRMTIRISTTGATVKIDNAEKFTRKNMKIIARNMLSPTEVSISKEFADSIRNGELRIGMTKEEAIMARGWPPAHKTGSLTRDTWTYWSSRFVTQAVVFKDGKLDAGRGIN